MSKVGRPIWDNQEPYLGASPATVYPSLRLAAAVMVRAAEEAEQGDLGAAQWFATDEARFYCEGLGMDHKAIMRKVRAWLSRPGGRLVVRVYQEA